MDLELHYDRANCYELVLDNTLFQEETMEAIVPDACPDILRIVDSQAQAFLKGSQLNDGTLSVAGEIRTWVLYMPEGDGGLQRLEVTLPFMIQKDQSAFNPQCVAILSPRVRWAESRPLNPRKILVRVDLAVDTKVYRPEELSFCSGITEPKQEIQQLFESISTDIPVSVQGKDFTVDDEVDLGPAEKGEVHLIGVRGEGFCSESKLIGNKLIIKGSIELDALFHVSGELKSGHSSIPFSQIIEMSGVGEDHHSEIQITIKGIEARGTSDSHLSVEVSAEILAQVIIWERRKFVVLRDIYSTSHKTVVSTQSCLTHRTLEHLTHNLPVRELLETASMVRSVYHYWADLGEVQFSRDGDRGVFSADVQFNIVYLDDGGEVQSLNKRISLQYRCDIVPADEYSCWCSAPKDLYVSPAAGGLEVRCTLCFCCHASQDCNVDMIASAALGEEYTSSEMNRPSIVLCLASPGERLWDLAKKYATTEEEIAAANSLEDDCLPMGKMLLIPRIR